MAFHFQNLPIEKALKTTIVTKENLNIITLSDIKVKILAKKSDDLIDGRWEIQGGEEVEEGKGRLAHLVGGHNTT